VEERAVLAVCRGLSDAGYEVSGVAGARPAAGHWSRSVSRRYTLPNPRVDPAGFVTRLAEIAARGEHAALVVGVDAALLAVSEHRDLFEPHLRVGLPPHDVVLRCLDKPALLERAAEFGLGPPPSETCTGPEDALAAAEQLGWPVVVKPARSLVRDEHRLMTSAFAADARELRELLPRFGSPVTLQRFERGAVVSCGGVMTDDGLAALCVARYGRTWPPRGGSASLSVTIEPPDGVRDRVESLLGELGWRGIFELELLELSGGGLAAIDLNPRPYGSLALASAAGANLPAVWCDRLLGRRAEPVTARAGVRYRWEEVEVLNLLQAARERRLSDAAAILRPARHTTHAFFRAADPAPLLARAIGVSRSRLRAGRRS
jgi:predicted ATP-grasp superfamily ATP-dependent carboligase